MHKIKNPFFKNFLLCLCIILTIKLIIIFIFLTQIRIKKTKQGKETPQFCFKEHCFILEIAKNQDEKEKGLMFREQLEENKGMIFLFDTYDSKNFWMKNTQIPLDIIRLGSGDIVKGYTSAAPCKEDPCEHYPSGRDIIKVIEVNSGTVKKIGLNTGDKINFLNIKF